MFFFGDLLHIIYELLKTLRYNSHYNSYEVIPTDQYATCLNTEILDPNPLGMYSVKDCTDCYMIPLKYTYIPTLPFFPGDSRFLGKSPVLPSLHEISRFQCFSANGNFMCFER